jgi:hypothetical protein
VPCTVAQLNDASETFGFAANPVGAAGGATKVVKLNPSAHLLFLFPATDRTRQ